MFQTTAAVIREPHTPFRIEPVELDAPRADEVLVRMVAAGMCHTDVSGQDGLLPFPMPSVLGHEGAGVVEAVGSAVTSVTPGDTVLLSYCSCGHCRACASGRPALCDTWLPLNLITGSRADGSAPLRSADGSEIHGHFFGQSSFSTLALAGARNVIRVDPDTPLEVLAPLGCAVQTGTGTVFYALRPFPGASLAVIGTGSVGLSAVMAAALSPATRIIAVDRVPARLALARDLGATDTVDATDTDLAAALQDLTSGRGVDLAIDTTGHTGVITATLSALAIGGKLALVGAPPFGSTVPVDVNFMLPGRSVVGITEGMADPRVLVPTLVELYQQGRLPIDRLITTYPFADLQVAANDLRTGRAIKPVLQF